MSKGRLIQGVKHALPDCVVKSSRGSYVHTECGRKFLDFTCGIGVTNLGHSHPHITAKISSMAENIVHAQQNIMRHRPMVDLIDKLASLEVSQRAGLDSWFFWNSGSEAVEAAIKLARQSTGRPNVIVANLGYHGRTYGTMALTTSGAVYRSGFGPLMGGVFVAQFPYLVRGPYSPADNRQQDSSWAQSVDDMTYYGAAPADVTTRDVKRCLESIELMLRTQTSPSETACIMVEPVLGEGGYIPCPPGYLKGLREICDRYNILLVADEVQTGFGRTGSMFAVDWLDGGVQPDILIAAKGIANGFPLSAIGTRNELSAQLTPGGMGGTYGGNAVSCAAALAVMDIFKEEDILGNCLEREKEMRGRLNSFFGSSKSGGILREVRGRGLMIGVEFEGLPGKSHGATAGAIAKACHDRDLLVLPCGPYDTLRFIPPLNISSQELNDGMDVFCDAVESVLAEN